MQVVSIILIVVLGGLACFLLVDTIIAIVRKVKASKQPNKEEKNDVVDNNE